jgi:hypothetical protein
VARSMGYRGRANLREQEEPAPGSHQRAARGSPRVHRFRKEGSVARQKRKEVAASVPARNRELGLLPTRRKTQLQKSAGDARSQINSRIRPPKRGPARVNGGLARGGHRRKRR